LVSPLTKVVIIMVCINIFLFFGAGVRVIKDNNDFMSRFINLDDYNDQDQVVLNDTGIKGAVSSDFQKSGTELLSFIDALGAVKSFVTFIINILFTPIGLFTGAGLPSSVGLIIGVPFIVLAVMGFAYYVRSGN